MAKVCDNKSVGILIEEDGRWLMIKRGNYPQAWAMIAGHVDDHGAERNAAKAEAKEEAGLTLGEKFYRIFAEDIDNPCKRPGGSHHHWTVFGADEWTGVLKAASDAKDVRWVTQEELLLLARRTEYFMKKYGMPFDGVAALTKAIFDDPQNLSRRIDHEWEKDPGLEPVWYYILKKLGKI